MNKFLNSLVLLILISRLFNSQCGSLQDAIERLNDREVKSLLCSKEYLKKEQKEKLISIVKKKIKIYGTKKNNKKDLAAFLLGCTGLALSIYILIEDGITSTKPYIKRFIYVGAGLSFMSALRGLFGANASSDYERIRRIYILIQNCPIASDELAS